MLFFKKKKVMHASDEVDTSRILSDSSSFAVKEAFRTLYTNVLYLPIEDKCKKIAVTSSFPGEGKTYLSANLAITLAQNSDNKKILLVDLDFRKRRISKLLKQNIVLNPNKNGLSEYLVGIDETINVCETNIANLSVVLSGGECPNPAALINSTRFENLIKEFSKDFDYIIFDTPPINVVSDALLLEKHINGFIISARSEYSNINDLSATISNLEKIKANIFGIVLTDVEPKSTTTHGKKYGNYKYKYNYS